jgi:hypothetical protein
VGELPASFPSLVFPLFGTEEAENDTNRQIDITSANQKMTKM